MSNLNRHPAAGMGALTQGFFVVPQDPIQMANEGISRVANLGELMEASFVVPQNPLRAQITGTTAPIGQGLSGMPLARAHRRRKALSGLGCGGSGGCGCGGACGGRGTGMGMGDLSADLAQIQSDAAAGNWTNILTADTVLGIPVWAWGAAALAVVYSMSEEGGGGGRRRSFA